MRAVAFVTLACALLLPGVTPRAAETNLCRINATPVRFGTYNPFARATARANGTISYTCSAPTPISIGLERSIGAAPTTRRMSQGGHALEYNLYLDAACTIVWGDGTGGSDIYRDPAPPADTAVAVPVYGCIRAGQRGALIGPYAETFAVTINF